MSQSTSLRFPRARSPRQQQRGVSMIELLVSLLIFSLGMLGLAGLQTRVVTYNQSSLFRTQAMALTDDVLDRMRLDRQNAISGNWNTTAEAAASSIPTGTQPYQFDLKDWKQQVEALLPSGQASITIDAASNNTVTVTLRWNDSRGLDNVDGIAEFETHTRL